MSRQNKFEAAAWDIQEQNKNQPFITIFLLFCPLLVAKVTNMWAFIVKI